MRLCVPLAYSLVPAAFVGWGCRAELADLTSDSSACDVATTGECAESVGGAIAFEAVVAPGISDLVVGSSSVPLGHPLGGLSPIAVGDVDGDGLDDVVVSDFSDQIFVLHNDGGLAFSLVQTLEISGVPVPDGLGLAPFAMSLTDGDGDSFPELWASGLGWVAVWQNQGGDLGEAEWVTTPDDFGAGIYTAFALGDLDGDHDIDVGLSPLGSLETRLESIQSPEIPPAAVTRVLYADRGDWIASVLGDLNGQTAATTLRFTDVDADADLDIVVPGDRGYALSLWLNDSEKDNERPEFLDVAGPRGIATNISGMAVADIDLNEDGLLDYAMTDIGLPRLFMSNNATYYESSQALGLLPIRDSAADRLSGWALRFADFNNDGWFDAFQASGSPVPLDENGCDPQDAGRQMCFRAQTDVLWMGGEAGFVDVGVGTMIASEHHHYGAIPADLDDDGDLDLLVGGYDEAVHVYENVGGTGAWLDIDLGGAKALGSRVVVSDGDRSWTREVANLSAPGQEPQRLHFGLGDRDSVERVEVWWLGGGSTVLTDVPTRRRVALVRSP